MAQAKSESAGQSPPPARLEDAAVDAWLAKHAGWARTGTGEGAAIAKSFKFADFSAALGFVVQVGLYAEKHDHHPELELGYGRARASWSTHDAGGITQLDLDGAEACDQRQG